MFGERRIVGAVVGCLLLLAAVNRYWTRLGSGSTRQRVILIQDGGIDDISAMVVLLGAERTMDLVAVLVQPADSYEDTAVLSTIKTLDALGATNVIVASSGNAGENHFPRVWRQQSDRVADVLQSMELPESTHPRSVANLAPTELLGKLLREQPHVIVCTAPLTYLAQALRVDPSIASNIEHVYIMGGAAKVEGNVENAPLAEWNFYNSPDDARAVIHSALSERITLVGLDVTRYLPVNQPLTKDGRYLGDLLLEQSKDGYLASTIAFHVWNVVLKDKDAYEAYHLWDTLTAVVAIKPDVISTKKMCVRINTSAPNLGQVEVMKEGKSNCTSLNVGVSVNKPHFAKVFLNALRH